MLFRSSEGGVAAGIRRIEGLTGDAAWQMARQQDQTLTDAAALLKVQTSELVHRIDGLMDRVRLLEKQAEAQQKKEIAAAAELAAGKAKVLSGLPVVMTVMTVGDAEQLRDAADRIRDRIGAGLVVLAADLQGKAAWVVMAGADATGRGLHAGNLVREAARLTGGGGGGRPDMAQAGGRQPERIPEAMEQLARLVGEQLADRKSVV